MARARWYPTATTLPDGRILVVSGDNITLNAPGLDVPLKNGSETLPEIYNVDSNTWTPLPAAQRRMPLYPFMFVLPDGQGVRRRPRHRSRARSTPRRASGRRSARARSTATARSCTGPARSSSPAPGPTPTIRASPRPTAPRRSTSTSRTRSGSEVAPMNHGRSYHTLTVLPDGNVLATGGMRETDGIDHAKAVFATEIWDPDTDTWTETASHASAARCTTRRRCCCRTAACCWPAAAPSPPRPTRATPRSTRRPTCSRARGRRSRAPRRNVQLGQNVHGQHARTPRGSRRCRWSAWAR